METSVKEIFKLKIDFIIIIIVTKILILKKNI